MFSRKINLLICFLLFYSVGCANENAKNTVSSRSNVESDSTAGSVNQAQSQQSAGKLSVEKLIGLSARVEIENKDTFALDGAMCTITIALPCSELGSVFPAPRPSVPPSRTPLPSIPPIPYDESDDDFVTGFKYELAR